MASYAKAVGMAPSRRDAYLDWLQMLTGVGLILFMWIHTLLTSSILFGPGFMNGVAGLLERLRLDTLVHVFVPPMFFAHFVLAARKIPFRAEGQTTIWGHAKMLRHRDTWLWVAQAVTAMIILVMGAVHMWTTINNGPTEAAKSAARIQSGGWFVFYLFFLPMVELHVFIGLYRIGVKWGYITMENRPQAVKAIAIGFAALLSIGLLALIRYATLAV